MSQDDSETRPLLAKDQQAFPRKESHLSHASYSSYEACTPVLRGDAERAVDLEPSWAFPYLYVSHGLSAFKDRLWQFAVPILLMEIWTDTMLPPAAAAFTCNIIAFVMMPYVGAWVDKRDRLKTLRVSIFGEASLIVISGSLLFLLARHQGSAAPTPLWDTTELVLFTAVCLINGGVEVAMRIGQQSLEKDWAVVLCEHVGRDITGVNQTLRVIDLGNKLLGPAAFGLFIQVSSPSLVTKMGTTVLALLGFNILSIPVEYLSISTVYFSIPELSEKKRKKAKPTHFLVTLARGWRSYLNHYVCAPSLAYGLLWYTVLDNGVLMTAYLKWEGIPEGPLGISRGLGALMGIGGTMLYGVLSKHFDRTETLGAWALWGFWVMLLPIPLYYVVVGNTFTGAIIMITCVTVSRTALWIYDQVVVRILQESLHESQRGVINGVHAAVCQLFLVAGSLTGMFFPDPRQFKYLILISTGSVLISNIIYSLWCLFRQPYPGDYPKSKPHTEL